MIFGLLVIGFLVALSVSDVKYHTIPIWPSGLLAAGGIALHLLHRDLLTADILAGLFPGLFLLFLSWIFRSSIGAGDGMVTAVCGLTVGFTAEFRSLTVSLLLCAVFSTALLILKKASRADSLPFIPFLAAGHTLVLIAGAAA